jgi:5-methylthioadenosine/S-adenosylhomocysteine deaminase
MTQGLRAFSAPGGSDMCILCNGGKSQFGLGSRRHFLKGAAAATGVAAAGLNLFAARPAAADDGPPSDSGRPGRRYVIRNGMVMSLDPSVPPLPRGDVLVEGKKILAIGPNLHVGNADEIDASGRVVMPGFIDTHHHQFETAIRNFLANGILINDGSNTLSSNPTYFEFIHHSPQHSDAAIQALFDTGRRAAFGYFESAGPAPNPASQYPQDATRIKRRFFSSSDQLVHMIMGGEVYLGEPTYTQAWTIGRQLGLQVAAHILSPFGIRPILDDLAHGTGGVNNNIGIGPDNLFIHMTGMSDFAWQKVKEKGAQVSIAFPIEMNMRHGIPPIHKMQSLGMEPSLSTDVEVTMTADFFTQMRSAMTLQRVVVNQQILEQGDFTTTVWPTPAPGTLPLLNVQDVLRFATINGAKHLRLDGKTGSLKPGKEADIIILDGTGINVFPINNVPNAVVSLMERTNVETVIVAGKVRKWKGRLLDVDLPRLRTQLDASRDFIFRAAQIPQNLFPQGQ